MGVVRLLYLILLISEEVRMKERVAGARGQSADGNYIGGNTRRVNYPRLLDGEERVGLFRKTEVGKRHFRFLVAFGGRILEFPKEKVVLRLV